jgi:hypothetical protein
LHTSIETQWPVVDARLALRSLLWAALLPGLVAGYVPWRFFGLGRVALSWTDPVDVLGLGVMAGALRLPHDGREALYTIIGVMIVALGHRLNVLAGE